MQEKTFIKFARYFLENPYKEFYLREIARKLKISSFAAKKYSDVLVKEGLLVEERKANLRYLKLNTNNVFAKYLKISLNLKKIVDSGLVELVGDKISNLSSIVLFGSVAKGEDSKESDFDIVIIGKGKHLDFRKVENEIGKEINQHIFTWGDWNKQAKSNKAFYLDVVTHGVSLYGELPVV